MAKKSAKVETDSVYFLKLLLYFTLGTIWIKVNGHAVVPVGLILGVIFSAHDHFRIDRKIEYAVLLVAALLGLAGFCVFIGLTV